MTSVWSPPHQSIDGNQHFPEILPHVVYFDRKDAVARGAFIVDEHGLPVAANRSNKNTQWAEFAVSLIEESKRLQSADGSKVRPEAFRSFDGKFGCTLGFIQKINHCNVTVGVSSRRHLPSVLVSFANYVYSSEPWRVFYCSYPSTSAVAVCYLRNCQPSTRLRPTVN